MRPYFAIKTINRGCMSLTKETKAAVLTKYQQAPSDTGSAEVQVALLSAEIEHLTTHFQTNGKDFHSRRGLLQKVSKRRKLLDYLKRLDNKRYAKLIENLGLRG